MKKQTFNAVFSDGYETEFSKASSLLTVIRDRMKATNAKELHLTISKTTNERMNK